MDRRKIGYAKISASWHKVPEGMVLSISAPRGYHILLEIPAEYCFCEKMTVNGAERTFVRNLETENMLDVTIKGGTK